MTNRRTYLSKAGDIFGGNLTHKPLLESLHEPAIAEVEAAWGLEIERRLAQYDRGGVINRCEVRPKPSFERTHSGSGKHSDDLAPGTLNSIFKQAGLK